MAVHYKFKCSKDYKSLLIDGPSISVSDLKQKILESMHLRRRADFILMVSGAQTNEDYLDEAELIPRNTSVIVRRVPRGLRLPIVVERKETIAIDNEEKDVQSSKSSLPLLEENDWHDFGDLCTISDALEEEQSSNNTAQDALPMSKAEEDRRIKTLINTWQIQDASTACWDFGRFMGGRMAGDRCREYVFAQRAPPAGYICRRCSVPGHFIRDCPTNGDPNYDIKKLKPPTGIPKSMLMETSDGSYTLIGGAVAALKPDETTFEREMEGLPSTRSATNIPPELHCPLCKGVMKDAVMTSKCCFRSYCDKCIRDCIISKSMCACGAKNVLADDLVPNKNVRDTINRLLESSSRSTDSAGSKTQIQDMESSQPAKPKVASPSLSTDLKRKREIGDSAERDFSKVRDVGIGSIGGGDVASSKLACKFTPRQANHYYYPHPGRHCNGEMKVWSVWRRERTAL